MTALIIVIIIAAYIIDGKLSMIHDDISEMSDLLKGGRIGESDNG